MQAVRLLRQIRLRPTGQRSFASHDIYPKTTMSDLPSPRNSWQANYDKNQQRYNRDLIIGIVTITATLGFGQYMGFNEFYGGVPAEPLEVETYRVEE